MGVLGWQRVVVLRSLVSGLSISYGYPLPIYPDWTLIGFLFRNIDNMAWNSNFMKKLIGFNIGMFAWAYYINTQTFGENLTPAPGRSNPLEVNWIFSRDAYIQWLCSLWLVFTVQTWNKYFLTPITGWYSRFTQKCLMMWGSLSAIWCQIIVVGWLTCGK